MSSKKYTILDFQQGFLKTLRKQFKNNQFNLFSGELLTPTACYSPKHDMEEGTCLSEIQMKFFWKKQIILFNLIEESNVQIYERDRFRYKSKSVSFCCRAVQRELSVDGGLKNEGG